MGDALLVLYRPRVHIVCYSTDAHLFVRDLYCFVFDVLVLVFIYKTKFFLVGIIITVAFYFSLHFMHESV